MQLTPRLAPDGIFLPSSLHGAPVAPQATRLFFDNAF
jgi:hypothetical protein